MQNKCFDSCVYPLINNKEGLNKINKIFIKKNYKGLIQITEDKKFIKYNYVKKKLSNLYPLIHISKKIKLDYQLNNIKKNKVKNIKIHPRLLKKKIKENFVFYKKIFTFCEKNKINIFLCTFSSWENKTLEEDILFQISKLSNILKNSNLILMHGGGTKILSYYELFRFKENVILDLSYTIQHFKNTTTFKDILFCINKFDKRIIVGSDYPSKKLSEYSKIVSFLEQNIKKKKFHNIIYKNLNLLLNDSNRQN